MRLLEWLRFARPHTSCLTWGVALLAVAVSGVNIFSLTGLMFFLFALLFHIVGFCDNNLCDYEFDKLDPNKAHFPLVKGTVSFGSGDLFVKCGLVLLVIFAVMITNHLVALVPLTVGIIAGLVYNRWSKRTHLNGMFISTCFAAVPAFIFVAITGELNYISWLVILFVFLQVYFQITVSGCLKEIQQSKEKNILRLLGATVKDTRNGLFSKFNPGLSRVYALILKLIGLMVALAIASVDITIIPFMLFIIVTCVVTMRMMSAGTWDRDKKLRQMSIIEIFTYVTLVLAVYPILGGTATVFLIVAPIAWFLILNRVLWGVLYPKV